MRRSRDRWSENWDKEDGEKMVIVSEIEKYFTECQNLW